MDGIQVSISFESMVNIILIVFVKVALQHLT